MESMMLLTILFSAPLFLGWLMLVRAMQTAPLGEENGNGFEVTWANDRIGAPNVSCIWKVAFPQDGWGDCAMA